MAQPGGKPGSRPSQADSPDAAVRLRAGPPKEATAGPRAPRLTTHKQRAAWFRAKYTRHRIKPGNQGIPSFKIFCPGSVKIIVGQIYRCFSQDLGK